MKQRHFTDIAAPRRVRRGKSDAGTAPAASPRVTIRDVAAAAGVSAMTVSNVINGRSDAVGARTARAVERAIRRLNYRVLSAGRTLRFGRKRLVGVILVDEAPDFLANPFMSKVLAGLSNHLNAHDHAMIVQGIHPSEFARAVLLRKSETDALCVKLAGDRPARRRMLARLARLAEPVVLIQETLPAESADSCTVRQDDAAGGRLLADHVAARRVRRAVVLMPTNAGAVTESRVAGFRAGLAAARANASIELVEVPGGSFAAARAATAEFLRRRPLPDAFFCCNDDVAIAAIGALRERGVRVPDDTLVTGFNGFNDPDFTKPTLTTICSRPREIGELAGRQLLARLANGVFPEREIVLPVHLREGQSTAAGDRAVAAA